jgi:hypothetical protein
MKKERGAWLVYAFSKQNYFSAHGEERLAFGGT